MLKKYLSYKLGIQKNVCIHGVKKNHLVFIVTYRTYRSKAQPFLKYKHFYIINDLLTSNM